MTFNPGDRVRYTHRRGSSLAALDNGQIGTVKKTGFYEGNVPVDWDSGRGSGVYPENLDLIISSSSVPDLVENLRKAVEALRDEGFEVQAQAQRHETHRF